MTERTAELQVFITQIASQVVSKPSENVFREGMMNYITLSGILALTVLFPRDEIGGQRQAVSVQ